MPCRVSSDVHEWTNEDPAVPARGPANPRIPDEQSGVSQREKKTPWSFTAACCWGVIVIAERSRELMILTPSGVEEGNNVTPTFHSYTSYWSFGFRTTVGGQFGWGGTPLKKNRGSPKVNSGGTETRRRGQGQKLA